ncbi:MAG TPA: hypothetical protein VEY33_05235 [Gemmatimonadota bacterium]|nr:hypothetical protein [Gemmatimonadota bacterium]
MIRHLVGLAVFSLATLVAACGSGEDPEAASSSPRQVVVRGAEPAAPPSASAGGIEIGPSETGAPEIVILPDPAPESRTRVVHETVVVDPPEAPAPSGSDADLTGAGAVLPAPRPEGEATAAVTLPAGRTQVFVTASTRVTTDASQAGEPVEAVTAEPVVVNGEVVIPEGSSVRGRIESVDPGEYPLRRPSIEIVYDRIETPDGRVIPIEARTSGEVGTVVQHPRGDHDRMRNVLLGAGVGAGVGGATGGKRGALLGAIAGAAMGAGVGHGGIDWCASVEPGDSILIILDRDAVVPRGPVIVNLSR